MIAKIEDEIEPPAFSHRAVYVDAELCGLENDGGLGDVALLIRREHTPDASQRSGWAMC
jgi:hypothetical protein